MEELNKVNKNPFINLIESKTNYIIDTDEKYNFAQLFENINVELEKVSGLAEIQLWKKNVKLSSNKVIGNLTKTTDSNVFNNKLKKIIISHGGTAIKLETDNKRKHTILFDALNSVLISNRSDFQEEINTINKENLYNLNQIQEPIIDTELNSWFHFKIDTNLANDLIYPRIISEFKENDWKTMYSIHDDLIVKDYINLQTGNNSIITSITLLIS